MKKKTLVYGSPDGIAFKGGLRGFKRLRKTKTKEKRRFKSTSNYFKGFKEGPELVPHYAEKQYSLGYPR